MRFDNEMFILILDVVLILGRDSFEVRIKSKSALNMFRYRSTTIIYG